MTVPRGLTIALLLTALGAPASGQDLKPWKHGVIEPKGDAGFMVMVGQRDFASRHGLKIEIVPLKNGATELLARLTALAIPIAVATSTSSDRARQKLRSAGILTHFTAVIGGDQVTNSKPHPDIYANAADVLGVTPAKCLALEDSENGVRSATSAGMTVIQIPDLVQPTQALRSLGHIILNSLRDVRTYAFQEENQGN